VVFYKIPCRGFPGAGETVRLAIAYRVWQCTGSWTSVG
jgi:hypothetical protein